MPEKKERIALSAEAEAAVNLSVLRLERYYNGKATFKIVGTGVFQDARKESNPPRLDLVAVDDSREFYFVVNKTNKNILAGYVEEYLDELEGRTITLEVYETGGTGNFAFGIRVLEVK